MHLLLLMSSSLFLHELLFCHLPGMYFELRMLLGVNISSVAVSGIRTRNAALKMVEQDCPFVI